MKTFSLRRGPLAAALLAGVLGLALTPASAAVLYIAGDSTVMTYKAGYNLYPEQGWGGRLPDYLGTGVTISNRAIGGRSSKSFVDEGRLQAIWDVIVPGDYLFVQFGHNDGRLGTATYKQYLAMYVDGAKQRGAIPVLVTPMGRRNYDSTGKFINDFTAYADVMKQLATEKSAKLIDLNAKSIAWYNSIGAPATESVFLWLQPGVYPNYPNGVQDRTHFQEYGAGQMARLVTQGIVEQNLAIKSFIKAITLPAESGTRAGTGTVIETTNAGFNGPAYINFPATGGTLTFTGVLGGPAAAGGTRTLRIRFALGSSAARTGQLVVNGVTTAITFNPTGAWTTWATKDVTITLKAGTGNTLQLKTTGGDLANIDELTVL
jgi:lysophospholipase L1-like esterase